LLCVCVLVQACPPSVLLSPSILSSMSSRVDVRHDESPDSGHRELSSDSLSTSAITQSDFSWHSALAASTTYSHELISRRLDAVTSSPTCPIIASLHSANTLQSSMSAMSNLVQLRSPPEQPLMSHTRDICGGVLKNTAVEGVGLVLPVDGPSSLSIADKSLSLHNDAQCFVNEDSLMGGQNDKSFFDDGDVSLRSVGGGQQQ